MTATPFLLALSFGILRHCHPSQAFRHPATASLVAPLKLVESSTFSRAHSQTTRALCQQKSRSSLSLSKQTNPFSTLLGDMASSILGSKTGGPPNNSNLDDTIDALVPSWDELRSTLESQQSPEERAFRANLDKGYGVASPLHKVRLYDESNKEEDIRVTFYRDSASWCPYCQKVWLTLEEKRIPYRVEKINMRCYGEKPRSFLSMQPSGNIPVAEIDGQIYGQSNDIIYVVEKLFPDHKSMRPPERMEMEAQELLRLERQIFSAWMYWLTGSERSKGTFINTLQVVEAALAKRGPFFLGKEVSMVDMMFAPFLERMAASLLFFKGFQMRVPKGTPTDFPAVNKWFDAMETLESYQLTKSDYYTHCWDLPPQLGGCTYEPAGEPYENAINGLSRLDGTGGSWEFPLQPHNGGVEPDWDFITTDEDVAKREAVERLTANHAAIVPFAARGAGKKGMPPYSAALADPNATPNENLIGTVGTVLRAVCNAMLTGVETMDDKMKDIATSIVKEGGKEYTDGVIYSIVYLRDRVGVPRDMKLPAARQLRAHLNWAIGKLLTEQDANA